MCGRFILYTDEEQREIRRIIDKVNEKYHTKLEKGDISPSQVAPVYKTGMELDLMHWGFETSFSKKLLINSRSETVLEKPIFRSDFLERRCLIPAQGFYEWDKAKNKYLFKTDEPVLYLGGFYQMKDDGERFTILTKEAEQPVSSIHNRMPVIVPPEKTNQYLESSDGALELLTTTIDLKQIPCGNRQISFI